MTNLYADQVNVACGLTMAKLVFGAEKNMTIVVYVPTEVLRQLPSVINGVLDKMDEAQKLVRVPS